MGPQEMTMFSGEARGRSPCFRETKSSMMDFPWTDFIICYGIYFISMYIGYIYRTDEIWWDCLMIVFSQFPLLDSGYTLTSGNTTKWSLKTDVFRTQHHPWHCGSTGTHEFPDVIRMCYMYQLKCPRFSQKELPKCS